MTIELLKSHTHAGNRRVAGDRLELPEASARWLIAQGIAKQVEGVSEAKPARRDLAIPGTPLIKGD
jgi:hypothetical protein